MQYWLVLVGWNRDRWFLCCCHRISGLLPQYVFSSVLEGAAWKVRKEFIISVPWLVNYTSLCWGYLLGYQLVSTRMLHLLLKTYLLRKALRWPSQNCHNDVWSPSTVVNQKLAVNLLDQVWCHTGNKFCLSLSS